MNSVKLLFKLLFLQAFILGSWGNAHAQNWSYSSVKDANRSLYNIQDSCILVKTLHYNRFTQDTTEIYYSFLILKNSEGDFYIVSATKSGTYLMINDSLTLISKDGDTLKTIATGNGISLDDENISNRYFGLKVIPTTLKGNFSRLKYSRAKEVDFSKDTLVIVQKDKKYDQVRYLYLDRNLRVIKCREMNNDEDRPDGEFSVTIHYFKHNCFDSLNKQHFLGKYWRNRNYTRPQKDTLTRLSDTLWLRDGTYRLRSNYDYVILDYWYLSCRPCIQMHPFMNELYNSIDTSRVLMLGVDPYDDTDDIDRYFLRKGYSIPQFDAKNYELVHSYDEYPIVLVLDSGFYIMEEFKGYGGLVTELEIRLYLKSRGLIIQ